VPLWATKQASWQGSTGSGSDVSLRAATLCAGQGHVVLRVHASAAPAQSLLVKQQCRCLLLQHGTLSVAQVQLLAI
jgi:hypothetical protein